MVAWSTPNTDDRWWWVRGESLVKSLWKYRLCVLYVAPAESQSVREATHQPASRGRYPTISHKRMGGRQETKSSTSKQFWDPVRSTSHGPQKTRIIWLNWVAEKQKPGESVKCHICWSGKRNGYYLVEVYICLVFEVLLLLLLLLFFETMYSLLNGLELPSDGFFFWMLLT